MKNKKARIAMAFTVVSGLLVWLTVSGFNDNMQYYASIKDVHEMGAKAQTTGLRVKGFLVEGSVQKSNNSLDVYFVIEESGKQLRVHYDKELPDTFKDGSEVLVEGKMDEAGVFQAQMLMAKCPSKYDTSVDEYSRKPYGETATPKYEGTN